MIGQHGKFVVLQRPAIKSPPSGKHKRWLKRTFELSWRNVVEPTAADVRNKRLNAHPEDNKNIGEESLKEFLGKRRLVLSYFNRAGKLKNELIVDDADFREVTSKVNGFEHVICIKLSERYNGRQLYLSSFNEMDHKHWIKAFQENMQGRLTMQRLYSDGCDKNTIHDERSLNISNEKDSNSTGSRDSDYSTTS